MDSFSLYIHIPFCKSKCKYCDFYSVVLKEFPIDDYFKALKEEFKTEIQKPIWKNREIKSIYFGGGTPSIIEGKYYKDFLNFIFSKLNVKKNAQITLEGNPSSLSLERLKELKDAGINRLSIGAQSFSNKILETLGRNHKKEDIIKVFYNARDVGFKNISLDLIFGVWNENTTILKNDLKYLLKLSCEHISTYALSIEDKTFFGKLKKEGKIKELSDIKFENQEKIISSTLEKEGYERYEISNFAKKGFSSKHNLSYWDSSDYLGLGAGAFSAYTTFKNNIAQKTTRYSNIKSFKNYIDCVLNKKNAVDFKEEVTGDSLIFEYIMLSLRKKEGINVLNFKKRFNKDFFKVYENVLPELFKDKLLLKEKNNIFINPKMLFISNSIIEEFLK